MLKELFELVKNNAAETVVNNPDVPNEYNDDVIAEATNTVASGMRNVVAGGGTESLVSLFGNKDGASGSGNSLSSLMRNPIVSMMIGHFASKLMSKYKLGGTQANSVAGSLIPSVISALINKNGGGSEGGFSLDGLLNSITGGQSGAVATQHGGGIGDILSQFTNGENNNSGTGGGLMDILGQLAGGAQQQQQRNGGGGLMDLIKGFMK